MAVLLHRRQWMQRTTKHGTRARILARVLAEPSVAPNVVHCEPQQCVTLCWVVEQELGMANKRQDNGAYNGGRCSRRSLTPGTRRKGRRGRVWFLPCRHAVDNGCLIIEVGCERPRGAMLQGHVQLRRAKKGHAAHLGTPIRACMIVRLRHVDANDRGKNAPFGLNAQPVPCQDFRVVRVVRVALAWGFPRRFNLSSSSSRRRRRSRRGLDSSPLVNNSRFGPTADAPCQTSVATVVNAVTVVTGIHRRGLPLAQLAPGPGVIQRPRLVSKFIKRMIKDKGRPKVHQVHIREINPGLHSMQVVHELPVWNSRGKTFARCRHNKTVQGAHHLAQRHVSGARLDFARAGQRV